MTIGGVSVGTRARPATITPSRVVSVGYSMAGTVQQYDFNKTNQLVPLNLPFVSDANRTLLQLALEETSKPGGVVSVTPDSGDNLGCSGVTGGSPSDFFYVPNSFRATIVKPGYWAIDLTLRYIA